MFCLCVVLCLSPMWRIRVASASASDGSATASKEDAEHTLRCYLCPVLVRGCVCYECGFCGWRVVVQETGEPLKGWSMVRLPCGGIFVLCVCGAVSVWNVVVAGSECECEHPVSYRKSRGCDPHFAVLFLHCAHAEMCLFRM